MTYGTLRNWAAVLMVLDAVLGCQQKPQRQQVPATPCSDSPTPTKVPGAVFMLKPPSEKVDIVGIDNVEGALADGYCFASLAALETHDRNRHQLADKVQRARAAVDQARAASAPNGGNDAGLPEVAPENRQHMLELATPGLPPVAYDTDAPGYVVDRFLKEFSVGKSGIEFQRFSFAHGDDIPVGGAFLRAPDQWARVGAALGEGWQLITYRVASRDLIGALVEGLWDFCLHTNANGYLIAYYDTAFGATAARICADSLQWERFRPQRDSTERERTIYGQDAREFLSRVSGCEKVSVAPSPQQLDPKTLFAHLLELDPACEQAVNRYFSRTALAEKLSNSFRDSRRANYKAWLLLGKPGPLTSSAAHGTAGNDGRGKSH